MSESIDQRSKHEVYERLHATEEFAELRHRYRGFAFPWTAAFLSWYLLYVLMSIFAHDFMSIKVVGNINVALVFGLLQFVSTFTIARLYAVHANKSLDPLSKSLRADYDAEIAGIGGDK